MDVLSRVIAGAAWAFGIAIPAVVVGIVVGVPFGLYTGYRGGWFDEVAMRFFDALRVGWYGVLDLLLALLQVWPLWVFVALVVMGIRRWTASRRRHRPTPPLPAVD
jgi:peptide/nickel transport system permease protein